MPETEKYRRMAHCLDMWLSVKEENKSVGKYLKELGIATVGVYGCGIIGRHLMRELQGNEVQVKWLIDKRMLDDNFFCSVLLADTVTDLQEVDIAINTALGNAEEVERFLQEKGIRRIISADEVIERVRYGGNP